METNNQGLTKEEKIMFSILGIILMIAIGVLIIGRFTSNERKLEDNKTPITEQSEPKKEIIDDSTSEPEEILIEDETEEEEIYYPVVNAPSSPGTNELEKPITSPVVKPVILDWRFKTTMITNAYNGDIITIEKNVILSNGEEQEATISVNKYEQNTWKQVDISTNSFVATTGIYKYIYSCGSYTKELLLTVRERFQIESLNILKLNELLPEESLITQEEFSKYQNIINNSLYENIEGINKLTVNNYIVENNIIPLLVTTNTELTNKVLTTTKEGLTITTKQRDWYEEITPNSFILWLDLNTIDITNNIIDIIIDGVTYNLELNIIVNSLEEIPSNPEQGELDNENSGTEEDSTTDENIQVEDETETDQPTEEEPSVQPDDELENESTNEEDNILEENNSNEEEEEDIDPLEPTEDEIIENSSNNQETSVTQTQEEETLDPGIDNLGTYSP